MWYYRHYKEVAAAVVAAACLLVVCLATVLHVNALGSHKPEITVNGDPIIYLELGQNFEDPGATVRCCDTDSQESIPLESSGTVDTQKMGYYLLKYRAVYKDSEVTAYRSVRVVDKKPPVIQLTEIEGNYTLPGETYVEEGFTATDDLDGDITHLVRRSEKAGVITYAVRDRSGNETVVERRVRYKDTQPPVVSIRGDMLVFLTHGQAYQEPGYAASDNLEGDITAHVTVSGNVDSQTAGTYTLKYQVRDSYGNLGAAERIVCVLPEGGLEGVQPNGKIIYLTFDDGPGPHTDRLLDVLAKYNVKATFFVVNTGMIGKVERIAKEGHTVAIHTMTHKYQQIYANEDAYFEDLYGMQEIIEKHTGQKPTLIRFPGGTSNTISKKYNRGIMTRLTQQVTARGFRFFDWNVDSKDAGGAKTSDEVFANVVNGIGNKSVSVVLQHDLYGYSVDAVEQIITWGLANGYTFAQLTEGSPACEHTPNN